MGTLDAQWDTPRVRALVAARDFGGLVKLARTLRGWRQSDLGQATGYSSSTISRLEGGSRRPTDIPMVSTVAAALDIPGRVLAAILGVTATPPARVSVTADRRGEEDPMRRRTLLTAGLAIPIHLLTNLDEALAAIPSVKEPVTPADLAGQLRAARRMFDAGDHPRLIAALPELLGSAHTAAEQATEASFARIAACYDLATEALAKIGRLEASRLTADRSTVYADLSGSPLARAAAARTMSIVLRHTGQHATAQRITLEAASKVEATGLGTPEQASVFAQMLCTCAYAASQSGDRAGALELITDAERAARDLPQDHATGTFSVTPASVALYKVGVMWSLGDAGAALHAGRDLHPGQFPTAERRGRMHTDLARAWWMWGKPEQTAAQLLAAARQTPAEVRDRPAIRAIAVELAERHRRVVGVRELAAVVGRGTSN